MFKTNSLEHSSVTGITFFKGNTVSGGGNYIMNGFFPFNSSHFTSETEIHSYIQENILFLLDILNHIQWTGYGHADPL